jgi:ubiquinone/menaquinone biosynthesis C-methylase UbiE
MLRDRVIAGIAPDMCILDLGAGRGAVRQMNFRGRVRRVVGLDPDARVVINPYLDQGVQGLGDHIPFPDGSFDLVICDNVLEHVEHPAQVLREVVRVLKPGGGFLAKTPNRNHYMPLIARLTPTAFHRFVNRIRGRSETDTFPTQYRINTPRTVREFARQVGLEVESIRLYESRPEYLRMTAPTYLLGALYERLVNFSEAFSCFRIVMLIELRKPTA